MEDNKQDQPNTPDDGNVMDVQRPQSLQNEPVVNPPEASPTAAPEPSKPGLSPELIAQAEAETQKSDAAKPDDKLLAAHGSHKKGPKLVVVAAVLVFLALAGMAVYAYMQSQKKDGQDNKAADTTHQESTEQHTEPATTKDVDDATKELDETINATDEAQEIPADGLSEESVGL